MALDVASILTEIQTASASADQVTSRQAYDYVGLMIQKFGIGSNGISTYTVNGRSVTRSVKELLDLREHFRHAMNTEEYGGIGQCAIRFPVPT